MSTLICGSCRDSLLLFHAYESNVSSVLRPLLPMSLRQRIRIGLGTIYLINTVLAIFSATSAPSRNQSSLLWGAKTFAVGAIAYDQLMQIPTPEELRDKARKEEDMMRRMQGRRGGRKQK